MLNTTEILISKDLMVLGIKHDEFVSVNVLREFDNMNKEIEYPKIFNSDNIKIWLI